MVLAGIPRFRGALRAFEPLIFLADQYARLLRPISRDEAARAGAAYADICRATSRRCIAAAPTSLERPVPSLGGRVRRLGRGDRRGAAGRPERRRGPVGALEPAGA